MTYPDTTGEIGRELLLRLLPAAAVVLVAVCLVVVGKVRRKRLSMDDNLLMVMLFDMVLRRQVTVLFINRYVACIDFNPIKHTKTTTTVYSDGSRTDSSTERYIGRLQPSNVLDFNQMGYKAIPRWELREYKRQMLERIRALPFVKTVKVYHMDTFTPEDLFINGGKHTTHAYGETCWVIEYENVGQKVVPAANGLHIG